jgi:hypothetical protein
MSSFIGARRATLLDERLMSTAGWWAEAAATRSSFIQVESPLCTARQHLCTAAGREKGEHFWAVHSSGRS